MLALMLGMILFNYLNQLQEKRNKNNLRPQYILEIETVYIFLILKLLINVRTNVKLNIEKNSLTPR